MWIWYQSHDRTFDKIYNCDFETWAANKVLAEKGTKFVDHEGGKRTCLQLLCTNMINKYRSNYLQSTENNHGLWVAKMHPNTERRRRCKKAVHRMKNGNEEARDRAVVDRHLFYVGMETKMREDKLVRMGRDNVTKNLPVVLWEEVSASNDRPPTGSSVLFNRF